MNDRSNRLAGKMPRWQRWTFWLVMSTCCLSGICYLVGNEFLTNPSIISSREVITTHGVSAYLAVFVFGTISMGHIRLGWILRKNKATGIGNIVTLSLMILTGLGLYYGSEEIRDLAVLLHWISGLGFLAVLTLHLVPFHGEGKQKLG
jgi:hypothetical protein